MQFDYSAKNAAYVRQHGRCAKCGKYLNTVFEDRRGFEGAWTAHDLMPLDEGGSNKAHNCVILCITEPDCHRNFAHGGDPSKRVFLTQFAFSGFVFRNGGKQECPEAIAGQNQRPAQEAISSKNVFVAPLTESAPWATPSAAAGVRPLTRPAMGP